MEEPTNVGKKELSSACNWAMETIAYMLEGELSDAETEALAKHLSDCDGCSALFSMFQDAEMKAVEEEGRKLAKPEPRVYARGIMGQNFFGIREAITHLGVKPTRRQLKSLAKMPFSQATLQQCKDTHILSAVFPISILEIRGKTKPDTAFFSYKKPWYDQLRFANERGNTSWQLIRKSEIPKSTYKDWQEQRFLLGQNEEVPTARVFVYALIGHYFATGNQLFQKMFIRTASLMDNGKRVCAGFFNSAGLMFIEVDDNHGSADSLGITSARKPEDEP